MATVHRAAPGIPKTVGSESGVESSLTKASYTAQTKSLENPADASVWKTKALIGKSG